MKKGNIEHRTSNAEHPLKTGGGDRPRPSFSSSSSNRVGVSSFLLAIGSAVFTAYSVCAQTNSTNDEPKLSPPYGEIPPSFWEQHGVAIGWSAVAVVLLIGIIVALRLRSRPAVVIPPEVQARTALNALASRPEDGRVLSEVSQIVRRYFVAAFQLPPQESTTSEFCRTLSGNERIGGELAAAVSEFLKQCDVRKFSPSPDASPTSAVSQALALIDKAERRRAALEQTSAATRA